MEGTVKYEKLAFIKENILRRCKIDCFDLTPEQIALVLNYGEEYDRKELNEIGYPTKSTKFSNLTVKVKLEIDRESLVESLDNHLKRDLKNHIRISY